MTENKYVKQWVAEMAELTAPDAVVWITGEEDQTEKLRQEAIKTGYKTVILPEANRQAIVKAGSVRIDDIKLIGIKHIRELEI